MTPEAAKSSQPLSTQAPRQYINLEPSALDQYIGHYKLDAGLETYVREQNGKLMAEVPGQGTLELHPLATNRFFIEQVGGEVEFTVEPDGPVRLQITQEGSTMNGERTALAPWQPTNLEQYRGIYWSDELETQYTITLQGGKLTANHIRHGEIALIPASQDRFITTEWFMPEARFLRDASNGVSGLTLGGGRVTAIRFNRKISTGAGASRP
jgi:hypothetical protein